MEGEPVTWLDDDIDPIPARMVNEFVYCPRLFYLEWVDGRWRASDDTVEGASVHRSNDDRGGALPSPDADSPPLFTTSVRLSDPELGLTAVIDRVDHAVGSCSVREIKKGRPAPGEQAWPADRAQVLAQAALLHRAGYQVESVMIAYAQTDTRVEIAWHEGLVDEVTELIGRAREVSAALEAPLPLVDSPKCPRCSLIGLCLPDETNALLARSEKPPRRFVPRNPDQLPLYVSEQGARIGVRGGELVVSRKEEVLAKHRLIDVSQVCVFGHVQVSTEALAKLWAQGAVVLYLSYGGWLNGWSQGKPHKYARLRRRQVAAHSQGAAFARPMIRAKIRNQRTMLRRNAEPRPREALDAMAFHGERAAEAMSVGELFGHEGSAAKLYFENFTSMLRCDPRFIELFDVHGRTRRPPTDPVNAVLSFCYSLLLRDVVATCLGVGLDPFIGVLHRERYGRPSLALDLAEEFRPLVADSVTLTCFNFGELAWSDFRISPVGVMLTQAGRRTVIQAYERRMAQELTHPVFGYRISYRRCLDVQARLLAAALVGELDEYTGLVTR